MIWNFLWPLMFFCSVVLLPLWLWRRMKYVQQAARDALDEPSPRDEAWEETAVSTDGLNFGRAHAFDPALAKASRDAEGSDDVKNLEGRR